MIICIIKNKIIIIFPLHNSIIYFYCCVSFWNNNWNMTPQYIVIKIAPSTTPKVPSRAKINGISKPPAIKAIGRRVSRVETWRCMIILRPNTKPISTGIPPSKLPKAMAGLPESAAFTVIDNSGKDVKNPSKKPRNDNSIPNRLPIVFKFTTTTSALRPRK